MALLGSLFRGAGIVVGTVAQGTCVVAGGLLTAVTDNENFLEGGKTVGEFSKNIFVVKGAIVGKIVDTTIEVASEVGGGVGGAIAETCGGTYEDVQKAKLIGKAVGGGMVGFLAGDVIGAGVTAFTVTHGIASTGTAIGALHGVAQTSATLAHIGGGALNVGGGGIVGGHAILTAIDVVSTVDSAVSGANSQNTPVKDTIHAFQRSRYDINTNITYVIDVDGNEIQVY